MAELGVLGRANLPGISTALELTILEQVRLGSNFTDAHLFDQLRMQGYIEPLQELFIQAEDGLGGIDSVVLVFDAYYNSYRVRYTLSDFKDWVF